MVGATSAYAMLMRGIGREIVLVDKNKQRAEAEAEDLNHAVPFVSPILVHAGDYKDLAGAKVIVLAAGVNQKPGESRTDLLRRNADIFAQVVPDCLQHAADAVFVVATNPVDVLTHQAATVAARSGIAKSRVIGSGTTLDTARFRSILGRRLLVDAKHVHANVLGEHGDSEVLVWSAATVAGQPIDEIAKLRGVTINDEDRKKIDYSVRHAAYSIIEGKGATYYGVGGAISSIVDAIMHNRRTILTVASHTPSVGSVSDVTLSMPRIIGGEGIVATLPTPLSRPEESALEESAKVIRESIDQL